MKSPVDVPASPARAGLRVGGAVITAGALLLALLLTLLLRPWLGATQYLFFHAAVMVAAAVGGMRLAVAAIIAAVLLVETSVIGPAGAAGGTTEQLIRDALIVVVSLGVALLVDGLRRARGQAAVQAEEARSLSESLREQAAELEVQVMESEALASELEELNRALELQTDTTRRGAERSARLQRLTTLLLETAGEAGVSAVMVRDARRCVEADVAVLVLVGADGAVRVAALEGLPGQLDLAAAGPTPLGDAVHTGEPVWVADREQLESRYPAFAAAVPALTSIAAVPLGTDERRIGAVLFGFERHGEFAHEDRTFIRIIAHEGAQALERARLSQMGMRARIRAEFAERRLAFLAEASGRLSASFDYRMTLSSLADMCAPELADWCLVHLHDDTNVAHLIAAVHVDTERVDACRALEERYPGGSVLTQRSANGGPPAATELVVVDDDVLGDVARDDEHRARLRHLGFHSQLIAPIVVDEGVRGTITLGHSASGRSFGDADVRLAAELGRRAGQAVENARLYQAAQFASEAKSDFLAVISHELRTPLNAIIGYADLLLLGIPAEMPAQTLRQVERIRSASDGLLALVEEVLSFSRIEAGKEEIRISPVDVSAMLRECVALVEPMAAQKSLEVELHLPDSPVRLVSDERKIRQIVTNLLSNAVKFTEEGTITVRARSGDDEVRIEVVDTGIGIPQQHLERIFDPFWQVEQSATRRYGGTGLGLGVARKLARLLEGRLEVHSEVGRGSCFVLALPLRVPGLERRR